MSVKTKSEEIDWTTAEKFLTYKRFKPMYDKAFNRLIKDLSGDLGHLENIETLRIHFLKEIDLWLNSSEINKIIGLDKFPHHDVIIGVTHALDDLHITHYDSLVILEKEYAYYKRMRPDIKIRNLSNLASGDVLVMAIPFAHFGDLHPDTNQILNRCSELNIPVHVDAAWYGCMRDFNFDYSHPAIQSVSFSLSKGLGLGSHRAGIRYSRERWPGPVTIINDFNMGLVSPLWYGINFMREFPVDFLQKKYGEAYEIVCEKLNLRKTKAIHVAMKENEAGEFHPVGVRAFLRTLADNLNELI